MLSVGGIGGSMNQVVDSFPDLVSGLIQDRDLGTQRPNGTGLFLAGFMGIGGPGDSPDFSDSSRSLIYKSDNPAFAGVLRKAPLR